MWRAALHHRFPDSYWVVAEVAEMTRPRQAGTVIPVDALFAASDALAEASIPVQWHLSFGVAHGIDGQGLKHGGQFLSQSFGLRTPV